MRLSLVGAAIFTLSAFVLVPQVKADPLPTEIGACSETTIADIGYRLGDPDSGSAISYAESTMGIVEFYHLGEIVGEPTAGTNGNINPFSLPGGYSLTWTGMKVLKQDGARHHGVGIAPTVPVGPTVAGMAAGKDEQLEKAIQLLDH